MIVSLTLVYFLLCVLRELCVSVPREGVIKYWTHAAGMTIIALIVPSLCAFFLRYLGIEDGEPSWVRTAYGIWYAHAGFASLTVILWLIEKPRRTKFVTTESDMVEWPDEEKVDPPQHNARDVT